MEVRPGHGLGLRLAQDITEAAPGNAAAITARIGMTEAAARSAVWAERGVCSKALWVFEESSSAETENAETALV